VMALCVSLARCLGGGQQPPNSVGQLQGVTGQSSQPAAPLAVPLHPKGTMPLAGTGKAAPELNMSKMRNRLPRPEEACGTATDRGTSHLHLLPNGKSSVPPSVLPSEAAAYAAATAAAVAAAKAADLAASVVVARSSLSQRGHSPAPSSRRVDAQLPRSHSPSARGVAQAAARAATLAAHRAQTAALNVPRAVRSRGAASPARRPSAEGMANAGPPSYMNPKKSHQSKRLGKAEEEGETTEQEESDSDRSSSQASSQAISELYRTRWLEKYA